MTIRKAIGILKRHDSVNVIVNERDNKSQEYRRSSHDLRNILINNDDNVEIILKDRTIEIPANEVIVSVGVTSTVFYKDLGVILFNY